MVSDDVLIAEFQEFIEEAKDHLEASMYNALIGFIADSTEDDKKKSFLAEFILKVSDLSGDLEYDVEVINSFDHVEILDKYESYLGGGEL